MDYEVEFHPVGDTTKSGDAISVRYRKPDGSYGIVVVDGGTADSGAKLVDHIRDHYGDDAVIEHVVSTHPDNDHASGLRNVLEEFQVQNLWLHGLWHHARDMLPYFADKRLTDQSLANRLRDAYPVVEQLIALAEGSGAQVYEPFQGTQIGPFLVMSPTLRAYTRLVPQFRKGPESDADALKRENWWLGERKQATTFLGQLIEKAASWIDESWGVELLREGAITAAENETSTVLYGHFGGSAVLLTADAGVNALTWTCDYAQQQHVDFSQLKLIQVPHHGSRSNVTPTVLDRLLGPKRASDSPTDRYAIVSCPKDDEKHPRKMVVNAFKRRGIPVYKTQGQHIRHHGGSMPARNETPAVPFDWFNKVEAYD